MGQVASNKMSRCPERIRRSEISTLHGDEVAEKAQISFGQNTD